MSPPQKIRSVESDSRVNLKPFENLTAPPDAGNALFIILLFRTRTRRKGCNFRTLMRKEGAVMFCKERIRFGERESLASAGHLTGRKY
jgi:hypothetical protein